MVKKFHPYGSRAGAVGRSTEVAEDPTLDVTQDLVGTRRAHLSPTTCVENERAFHVRGPTKDRPQLLARLPVLLGPRVAGLVVASTTILIAWAYVALRYFALA